MTKKFDEALLATLFEHIGDAVEVTDTDLRIAYVNPAFEHITGYDKAEVLGRTPASLLRPEDADPELYEGIVRAVVSGQVWKGELVARRKDGSR